MKNLLNLLIVLIFISCSDATEDINPDANQDIELYRFKTFLIQVDYTKELTGGPGYVSPGFTLIESPNESIFHTNTKPYKPNLFFEAEGIPWFAVFNLRGINSRKDTIRADSRYYPEVDSYLIRVK